MTLYQLRTSAEGHSAPLPSWYSLANTLKSASNSRDIYLNEDGEHCIKTPSEVASIVKSGGVWVDWCGWPMWSQGGSGGFANFLRALGVNVLTTVPYSSNSPMFSLPNSWQDIFSLGAVRQNQLYLNGYPRSLLVDTPLNSPYVANDSAFENSFQLPGSSGKTTYSYASFAVKAGKGAYIYAFGNDSGYFAGGGYNPGVSLDNYASFIQQIVSSLPSSSSGATGGGSTGGGSTGSGGSSGGSNSGSGSFGSGNTSGSSGGTTDGTGGAPALPYSQIVNAAINGHPIAAVGVLQYGTEVTYLLWTSLELAGVKNFKYLGNGVMQISGKNVQGVIVAGNTYLPWNTIPGLTPHFLAGGAINFTTSGGHGGVSPQNGLLLLAAAGVAGLWFAFQYSMKQR